MYLTWAPCPSLCLHAAQASVLLFTTPASQTTREGKKGEAKRERETQTERGRERVSGSVRTGEGAGWDEKLLPDVSRPMTTPPLLPPPRLL